MKTKKKKKLYYHLEKVIKTSENYYEELKAEHKKTKAELQKALEVIQTAIDGETLEKYLKNEAYAFLLAEGLLDKFLEFREPFHRTKAQDALFKLVAEAQMGGLWIDL